jgi:hypothetical protein
MILVLQHMFMLDSKPTSQKKGTIVTGKLFPRYRTLLCLLYHKSWNFLNSSNLKVTIGLHEGRQTDRIDRLADKSRHLCFLYVQYVEYNSDKLNIVTHT